MVIHSKQELAHIDNVKAKNRRKKSMHKGVRDKIPNKNLNKFFGGE